MANWYSAQYLKFENQRTQPAIDLAARIRNCSPENVLDIGCGPGNSSNIVKQTFPHANVMGIDSSADMIAKARATYPDIAFEQLDANEISGEYDVLFSNACLQWIPDHRQLLPALMRKLRKGGALAVQFPMNGNEPLYQAIKVVADDPKWGFQNVTLDSHGTLAPEEYFTILSECSSSFQIWETVYYHNLPDHQAMVEWVKGTRIRPYLAHLTEEAGKQFEQEILEETKKRYPVMKNGEVVLHFRRFFFVAIK